MSAANPSAWELQRYIQNNYGECKLGAKCVCIKNGWMGMACGEWVPTRATTLDELSSAMANLYK